ncbi:conidiation-specific protein-8 [Colletotrichum kahawae]|uniref:Conidiation-specific protein-8 n=1 Tax=Colletotrichum kahawae TaxID=34407 RepID=A0AAD9YJR3_COLKA|nr:conidiation-specific protein-8 [Colletotrichum kahawae]
MDSGKTNNAPVSPTTGRRRSSGSGTLFQGLMDQKRHEGTAARRQSMTDSKPAPGFIGQMWQKYVDDNKLFERKKD